MGPGEEDEENPPPSFPNVRGFLHDGSRWDDPEIRKAMDRVLEETNNPDEERRDEMYEGD